MIPVTTLADRTVALFGLGGSGLSTARALLAGGARVLAFDDNPAKVAEAAGAGIPTADLAQTDFEDVAALVLSPGVPLTHPKPHWTVERAREANVPVIGDIELFERERRAGPADTALVAITGTNGKSTTTALVGYLLSELGVPTHVGGNIGTPALELPVLAAGETTVLEVSSYQIDLAPSLAPTVGVHLNISEDHLDRHGSLENYAAIKERVVAAAGTAVVGVDDPWSRAMAERREARGLPTLRVSTSGAVENGVHAADGALHLAADGSSSKILDLAGIGSLRGEHNAQNAAAAFAVLAALGLDIDAAAERVSGFPGLAHRLEQVGRRGRVLFVNDSKATNADSARRALASFERIYWIAGGRPKTGGIASLADLFPRVARAYLVGEAEADFAATLDGLVPVVRSGDIAAALAEAAEDAAADPSEEPVVLLSPACASFDQFPNFEARGDAFKALVYGLSGLERRVA
ncbi:UDP-N-acetylmuramoyl-L-alanine--D-glutamate ligase [Amorphus orientalis]|uniref:UDP-N-acetylmuramoylalanine--D-glutamate ligase n=1 Tax=Amorphus orientalis TaxID=649198 RepID=A0AAE4ASN9_9HYPH|nr:UDP-N-acetylmuramoyl-L-alanine--D-glutamate ligase [Amorphus orientalis]MDQ0315312.1 UDP-N-acetylmuramoylalanine--D-glutamate ligase [Amorphus orientalis]